jgi:hypothetical protein
LQLKGGARRGAPSIEGPRRSRSFSTLLHALAEIRCGADACTPAYGVQHANP